MNSKQRVYFRADAGIEIGYGHYMRCLALVDELKSNFECVMFTQDPSPYQIKETKVLCQLVTLPADASRFDMFLDYLVGDEIVVLDNYFYTTDYQQAIKNKGCKLVYIDDMHDKHFVADVVINHGFAQVEDYDVAPYTRLCIGPKYALLRQPFLSHQHKERLSHSWIVFFGGVDLLNLTKKTIETIQKEEPSADIIAIVGDTYPFMNQLFSMKDVSIKSRLSARELVDLLAATERVVCSASTVCYEALSQGCIVYAGWYMDNQKLFYEGLKEHKYIIPMGNLRDRIVLPNFRETNTLEFKNSVLLGLFVSLGLKRILYVDMTENQSRQVWQCRNSYEIRKCMTHSEPFLFDTHCHFIDQLKHNKTQLYYAYFLCDEFVASCNMVGMNKSIAEKGVFVAPKYQGLGVGKYIEQDLQSIAKKKEIHILKAKVLRENYKSYKFHIKNGYDVIGEDDIYIYLECKI